jgi:hypothetical protein
MAVQSSPSQQPLEDNLRMGQNINTETLSMSAPYLKLKRDRIEAIDLIFNIKNLSVKLKSVARLSYFFMRQIKLL